MSKIFFWLAYTWISLAWVASAQVAKQLAAATANIRYQVTAIEHQPDDKVEAFARLIEKTDQLLQAYPAQAEPWLWKGIALASQAKHMGIKALPRVKLAKQLLEKSIAIDPQSTGGAAYLALATLYYKVPRWPLSFRDDQQAELLFAKAMVMASHLDTHYRYGEFLLARKRFTEARKELQAALAFPDRPEFPEDALKKDEIRKLLSRLDRDERKPR